MTHQAILTKAIEKATANGWDRRSYDIARVSDEPSVFFYNVCEEHGPEDFSVDYSVREFIFSHDFAKALWGDQYKCLVCKTDHQAFGDSEGLSIEEPWVLHLQQMVIAKDPITYLGENI